MAFAFSGFEGFEKRLELHFFGDDPTILQLGLRKLSFECIQQTLEAVQCTVVSAVGNSYFDAYVLSESSLFVYPTKIIIKTCGTTQLLKSITPLIFYAQTHLGLTLSLCRYTRGSFIFPLSQPFPHTSFEHEVTYLETTLPSDLCFRKASISSSHSWHVFTATNIPHHHSRALYSESHAYTMEICMTDLDPVLARKFFRRAGDGKTGDSAGKEMTELRLTRTRSCAISRSTRAGGADIPTGDDVGLYDVVGERDVERGIGCGGAHGNEVEELRDGPVPGFWERCLSNVYAASPEKCTLGRNWMR
ncbi:S-adenosylmethionine decarboxylase proenzyme 1 [Glycine soja]|nr:S-adenosylmethionine decarboxylase proenzyme 1 [Glycine soja]